MSLDALPPYFVLGVTEKVGNMGKFIDLTGQKFGRLTVVKRDGSKDGHAAWLCQCECGNQVTISGRDLKNGHSKSCGCLKIELTKNRKPRLTHGETDTRLHHIWTGMLARTVYPCKTSMPNYKDYGGRGISVCDEWLDYVTFRDWAMRNGYRDDLTIDRIDVNGNYCPENCRWVDMITQQNNRRSNHSLTYNGKTQTIKQWAKETNIEYGTLLSRINDLGWSIDKALTTPERKRRYITYGGKTKTISEWAIETGLNRDTIKQRIFTYGWSVEKALTTPPKRTKKKKND